MKLWDLPNNSYFTIDAESVEDCRVPPGAPAVSSGTVYWLGNINGMFSYCTDPAGNVVHVIANARVMPHPAPVSVP